MKIDYYYSIYYGKIVRLHVVLESVDWETKKKEKKSWI